MRVVVIGAGGLLGTAFQLAVKESGEIGELLLPSRQDLDITQKLQVERYLMATHPDVVINAAALLPADLCEIYPQAAYEVHALGARWVAQTCGRIDALAVYISSDFVFDGDTTVDYPPDAVPHPQLSYGITKLAGELETSCGSPRHHVLRTAGLFGPAPANRKSRPCFVDRVLDQAAAQVAPKVVDSMFMSPTYTVDLARMALGLAAEEAPSGIYHAVNSGHASWYEVAVAAVRQAGYPVEVIPVQGQHLVSAPRPNRTVLSGRLPGRVSALQRPWREALGEYVEQYWTKPERT